MPRNDRWLSRAYRTRHAPRRGMIVSRRSGRSNRLVSCRARRGRRRWEMNVAHCHPERRGWPGGKRRACPERSEGISSCTEAGIDFCIIESGDPSSRSLCRESTVGGGAAATERRHFSSPARSASPSGGSRPRRMRRHRREVRRSHLALGLHGTLAQGGSDTGGHGRADLRTLS